MISVLLVVATACGGDGTGDGVDASAATVTIDATATSLVAARPVGGTWSVLTPDGAGMATYQVDRPFEVVMACSPGVVAFRAAPADVTGDARQFAADCFQLEVFTEVTNALDREVQVTIAPLRRGHLGGQSLLAPGARAMFSVEAGVHDVVVQDLAGGTAGVQRGAVFAEGGTVTISGVTLAPLTSRAIDVVAPGPTGMVKSVFESAAGGAMLGDPGGDALTVATSVAQSGDRHLFVYEERVTQVDWRRRSVDLDPSSTATVSLTPPPIATAVMLTGDPLLAATYEAAGDWPRRTLIADLGPSPWRVELFAGSGDAVGTATAPDPTGIPGWDPAWNVTSADSWDLALVLAREDATGRDEIQRNASWPTPP